MKKVQLFKDTNIAALQESINAWLDANKNFEIIHSNLSAYATDPQENGDSEQLVFYILYNESPEPVTLALNKMEEPLKDDTAEIAKKTVVEDDKPTPTLAN